MAQSVHAATLSRSSGNSKKLRGHILRNTLDPLHVSLLSLVVLTISRAHQPFPFVAAVRPLLVLTIVSFVLALVNPRMLSQKGLFFTWPPKVVLIFALLACLSMPFGISVGGSAAFILQEYAPVLVVAALLVLAIRGAPDLYRLIWAFVIGAGILSFFANYVFPLTVYEGQARLGSLYMGDANDAGLIIAVSIPLTLLTLQCARWPGRLVSMLFLYWDCIAIGRTGSRGAFVGIIVVGASLLLLADNISAVKRLGILITGAAVLILAAPQGYWKQMSTIMSPTDDYNWTSAGGRMQIAQRGLQYILDYPVTGIGIGNFSRAEGTISDRAKNWARGDAGIKWSAPHNSHIEAGAELGVPGLIVWTVMLIGGIVGPLRLRRRLPRHWRKGAPDERFIYAATVYVATAIIGFTVCCTFVSFTYLDPIYILLAFVTGLYVCADALLSRSTARSNGMQPRAQHEWQSGLKVSAPLRI